MGRATTLIINELQWWVEKLTRVDQVVQPGHKQTQRKITDRTRKEEGSTRKPKRKSTDL